MDAFFSPWNISKESLPQYFFGWEVSFTPTFLAPCVSFLIYSGVCHFFCIQLKKNSWRIRCYFQWKQKFFYQNNSIKKPKILKTNFSERKKILHLLPNKDMVLFCMFKKIKKGFEFFFYLTFNFKLQQAKTLLYFKPNLKINLNNFIFWLSVKKKNLKKIRWNRPYLQIWQHNIK